MEIRDGQWMLVNHDLKTKRTIWKYYDGENTHFRTDYHVDDVLGENKKHFNQSQGQKFGNGKRVASIPLNIFYEKLVKAQTQGDNKYIRKWLNDSDNKAFRTFEGNV